MEPANQPSEARTVEAPERVLGGRRAFPRIVLTYPTITVLQMARAINVGRCERGGTLWVGPIDNRPQLTKLPHKVSTSLVLLHFQPRQGTAHAHFLGAVGEQD
jgi:hypothetical protein